MENKKTSVFSNCLIWFGAGISVAEILTGTLLAPLGFVKGLTATLLGHLIGCVLLFLAGIIGAKTEKSSMETVKMSFGQKGSVLFSVLNVLQLVGWTAIMILSGAQAADGVLNYGSPVWRIIIGILIMLWIAIGIKILDKINTVAMIALLLLTIVLSKVIFKSEASFASPETISFGAAVELSVAMPLSWLPLISDYTRYAKKPVKATLGSTVAYFIASVWMYVIGMGAAIFTGETDVGLIMIKSGLGLVAIGVIVLSTVTTTFLDAYSAGVSCESISSKLKEKPMAMLVCVVGIMLAIFTPIGEIEGFLYVIGSVFAPMIAVQITNYYILKKNSSEKTVDIINIVIWLAGFVIYRIFMNFDIPVGYTLPAMVVTALLTYAVNKLKTAGK